LSNAFDRSITYNTVQVHIKWRNRCGIRGIALDWIKSFYLAAHNRFFFTNDAYPLSCSCHALYFLGPIPFLLDTAELSEITYRWWNMCSLCWRHKVLQYKVLPDVLHKSWSGCNYVKMNEQKTQAIWLRTWQQVTRITEQTMTSSNDTIQFSAVVNDLGRLSAGR